MFRTTDGQSPNITNDPALRVAPFKYLGERLEAMSPKPTPNDTTISRKCNVRVRANCIADVCDAVTIENPPQPIRLVIHGDGASVWTHDTSRTAQVLVNDYPLAGLRLKEPCVLLVQPRQFSELLRAKFKDEAVEIETDKNEPITIKSKSGASVVYHAADEDDCATVPDHWILPIDASGSRVFPMFDNEPATSKILIDTDEVKRGLLDMRIANAPYVEFNFAAGGSYAQSGHWGAKTNQSRTPLTADIDGEDCTVNFTENLADIISRFKGSTQVEIQRHKKGGLFVISSADGPDVTIVATEAVRES